MHDAQKTFRDSVARRYHLTREAESRTSVPFPGRVFPCRPYSKCRSDRGTVHRPKV